ncbi:unnamed protein product, partial [Aphanomyces euteiches]
TATSSSSRLRSASIGGISSWLLCIGSIFAIDFLDDAIVGFFFDESASNALSCQIICMVTVGLSAAFCGPFIESRGPRMNMAIATCLVVLGWISAHLSVIFHVYSLLNLGIGVLVSAGYGITIIVSVSTVQKWFPDLRGIVTGLCIAGMGPGSLLWLHIYAVLLHRESDNIFESVSRDLDSDGLHHIFLLHGGVALVVMAFATIVLRTPPPNYAVNGVLLHRESDNIFESVSRDLDSDGLHHIFLLHGGVALVVMAFATIVLRTPPPNYAVNGVDAHCVPLNKAPTAAHVQNNYLNAGMTLVNFDIVGQNPSMTTDSNYFSHVKALSLGQCIFSSDFLFLYVAFAATIAPIVLFLFEMTEFATEMFGDADDQGNFVGQRVTITNALGNLLGPIVADVIIRVFYANPAYVRTMVFTALLLSQTIGLALLINHIEDIETFQWPLYIPAFSSSGGFGLIPSFLADLFGVYNAGTMYGLVLSSWIVSSLVIGSQERRVPDMAQNMAGQLQVLLIVTIVGCVVMVLVRSSSMDRFYRGYQLTICDKIVIQRPSRNLMKERNKTETSEYAHTDEFREWVDEEEHGCARLSTSTSPILLVDPDYLHKFPLK